MPSSTGTVTYAVASSVAPATVSNTATASAAGQPTDATDSASVDIHRSVSLAVDKAFHYFKANATTSIHTLSLHDALPISSDAVGIHLTDGVDNRLNVSSFSDHGTGQDCAASTGQNLDCTFDLSNGAAKDGILT